MANFIPAEKTVELEIPLVLPGIGDDRDGCLARLEASLQGRIRLLGYRYNGEPHGKRTRERHGDKI